MQFIETTPEDEDLEGGFFLSGKTVEHLEESLNEIKGTLEELCQVIYKGNGHSVISRITLIEAQRETLNKIAADQHELKNRVNVLELKSSLRDRDQEKDDGKVWDVVKMALAVVVSAVVTFLVSGKLMHP
jgi:hypothetical protein